MDYATYESVAKDAEERNQYEAASHLWKIMISGAENDSSFLESHSVQELDKWKERLTACQNKI